MIDGWVALYIFMLAAFTGYEIIARVPVILHTPLMSGSNFVHGIVMVGAMVALGVASTPMEKVIGFIGVMLGAGNAMGGYVVTERMLEMFKSSKAPGGSAGTKAGTVSRPLNMKPTDDDVLVRTEVKQNGGAPNIPINYSFYKNKDDAWKVYDVTIDGVSLVANYRSVYAAKVREQGMDGLLASMADSAKAARK